MTDRLLIFHIRAARRRARVVAEAEALGLLRGLDARVLSGGPLGERGGVFWVGLPEPSIDEATERFSRLGYSAAVDLLDPLDGEDGRREPVSTAGAVRWRGRTYRLVRLYEEDPDEMREWAPDRRTFLLETPAGEVRRVVGYRGDGGALSRRGLPVADARLLVNLVFDPAGGVLLDPFAGIGGVAIEALAAGWRVVTGDIDATLRHGLSAFGAWHVVADVARLPLRDGSVQAIATEPPYDQEAAGAVVHGLREMTRVLAGGGRLAMLVANWQREALVAEAARLDLAVELDRPVDRKGLPVVALTWRKPGDRASLATG